MALSKLPINLREKRFLIIVIIVIAVFIIFKLGINPLFARKANLDRNLLSNQAKIVDMHTWQDRYNSLQQNSNQIQSQLNRRPKNFSLISFLNRLVSDIGIKENVTNMRPRTIAPKDSSYKIERVEMTLKTITMAQLTAYLHPIEMSPNQIKVPRIKITRTKNPEGFIDAKLWIEIYTS